MKIANKQTLCLLAAFAVAYPAAANAAIGGIGSPVVPSNAPEKQAEPEKTPELEKPALEKQKPIAVFRFDSNRVYFQRVLRQAIEAAETDNSGTSYEVISYVPGSKSNNKMENRRINEKASRNLRDVVSEMHRLGVNSSRISVQTFKSSDQAQEIHINAY